MQLDKALELFLGEHIETTRKAYKYELEKMRDYVGSTRPLANVRSEDLIEYMQTVRKRPAVKSPATYNKYVKNIRTFFNWCVRVNLIEVSPAAGLKRLRQNKLGDIVKAMPHSDYEKLLDYAKWTLRYYVLVLFIGDTGCRIGGVAALTWDDVSLDEKKALVTEKGKPPRPVFFGSECHKALIRWRLQHSGRDGNYVFHPHGRKNSTPAYSNLFGRICQRAGLKHWGPHSLRHRLGHSLAKDKIAPSIVSQLLGHSSVITTLEYYYPDDWESVEQAAKSLHYEPEQKSNIIDFRRKVDGR